MFGQNWLNTSASPASDRSTFSRRSSGARKYPMYAADSAAMPTTPQNAADTNAHHVKSMIGITADVVIRPPGSIERSTGKAKRVRDLRPKD